MEAKQSTKLLLDPDILGLRKKDWNNSTLIPKNPALEETHERKLKKIKLGLFDQPAAKVGEKIFQPPELSTRHLYYGWNLSTLTDKQQQSKKLKQLTQEARLKNKQRQNIFLDQYSDPLQLYNLQKENIRYKKQTQLSERE